MASQPSTCPCPATSTLLKVNLIAGAAYSAHLIAIPHDYLHRDNQEVNQDTVSLTRAVGAGIFGLAVGSYLALREGGKVSSKVAVGALTGSLVVFVANNVSRVVHKNSLQAKVDLGVSAVLLAGNALFFFFH